MQLKNTDDHFGLIAILIHWLMALLLIGLVLLGLYMTNLPIGLEKLKLYGWHKEFGMLALFLVLLRISWRLANITPALNIPRWERIAARAMHYFFYFLMFAMPLTGWLITSAAGLPVSCFGLFVLPNLIQPDESLLKLFQAIHQWLGYALSAAICLHAAAALKHHFIDKDDILRRMIS